MAADSPTRREVALWAVLLAGAAALAWGGARRAELERGPLLSDVSGPLRELELHFAREAAPLVLPAYADLLRALPPEVSVTVAVGAAEDFELLRQGLEDAGVEQLERVHPHVVGRAISTWARDRCLPRADRPCTTLLVPRRPTDGSSPERRGDWYVPWSLAAARDGLRLEALPLRFDGGDLVVGQGVVFCDANLLAKNVPDVYPDRDALLRALEALSGGLRVELIGAREGDVPEHHIGMYLSPLADGSLLVADARFAGLDPAREAADLRAQGLPARASERVAAQCDLVARWLRERGYRVRRAPFFACDDPKVFLTWNNVLQEVRADGPHVYLPRYGVAWDERAAEVWRAAGYAVHPVEVREIFVHRGSVRCLTQVLARG
ncbi:MAG: hypothetical protein AB7N76_11955 [Planctomycetota bacterium]